MLPKMLLLPLQIFVAILKNKKIKYTKYIVNKINIIQLKCIIKNNKLVVYYFFIFIYIYLEVIYNYICLLRLFIITVVDDPFLFVVPHLIVLLFVNHFFVHL